MSPIERKLVTQLLHNILADGNEISVRENGEEIVLKCSTSLPQILAELASGEYDHVIINDPRVGRYVGVILLIWGNEEDVISDYTDTPKMRKYCDFSHS